MRKLLCGFAFISVLLLSGSAKASTTSSGIPRAIIFMTSWTETRGKGACAPTRSMR